MCSVVGAVVIVRLLFKSAAKSSIPGIRRVSIAFFSLNKKPRCLAFCYVCIVMSLFRAGDVYVFV